jgi:hypothetical protein
MNEDPLRLVPEEWRPRAFEQLGLRQEAARCA